MGEGAPGFRKHPAPGPLYLLVKAACGVRRGIKGLGHTASSRKQGASCNYDHGFFSFFLFLECP